MSGGTDKGKNSRIVAQLRQRIVTGTYPPGSRLPTCLELERDFRASRMTVLKALDQLKRDEFIRTDGRRGTFVSERPPQLHRYALVFSEHQLSRFSQALFQSTEAIHLETPRRLPAFFGIDGHTDVDDYGRLMADISAQRLAGMILVSQPGLLSRTPLLHDPHLPKVALVEAPDVAGIDSVSMDSDSYIRQAAKELKSWGCRRIGVLVTGHQSPSWQSRMAAAIKRNGMETRRGWVLAADERFPYWVGHAVAAIFGGDVCPDGFLIADDHLVEPATKALLELGVRVPDKVRVLAHGNYPCLPVNVVPVKWLGFHARAALETACDVIDARRRGAKRLARRRIAAQLWDAEGRPSGKEKP